MSLEDAIARNRARRDAETPTARPGESLRAFTVNVLIVPPSYDIALGRGMIYEEQRTIYGTSLADAKKRAGIE